MAIEDICTQRTGRAQRPFPARGPSSAVSSSLLRVPGEHPEIVLLQVVGEIDPHGHAALRAALADGLHAARGHLVVDLSGVTFCSVRGFCLIADAASAAAAAGTDFTVSGLPARLKRIALLVWNDAEPRLFRTADDAVSTIRTERADHRPRDTGERCERLMAGLTRVTPQEAWS